MRIQILLPVILAIILCCFSCKKEPSPIEFTVTNLVTGEPVPNAVIKWNQINIPVSSFQVVGHTDILGKATWNYEPDTLPNPQFNYFTCEAAGYYVEPFSFTDIDQKSFEVKMRQKAVAKFHLRDQDTSSLKSYSISVVYKLSLGVGDPYETGEVPLFHTDNKTVVDEWAELPVPDFISARYRCYKTNVSNPGNTSAVQIFEIPGRPDQLEYAFEVVW